MLLLFFVFLFLFFFSSRRRHTRFSRDWSSDVCSSDLRWAKSSASCKRVATGRLTVFRDADDFAQRGIQVLRLWSGLEVRALARRSEERRVGQERRSRRATESDRKTY